MKVNSFLIRLGVSFVIYFLFCCSASLYGQTHFPKSVAISANCKGYYEYLPVGYANATTKFPLLIYCGGAGSFGSGTTTQLAKLLTEGTPYYIKNNLFPASFTVNTRTSSFIVISPQFVSWPKPADVEAVINYVTSNGYKVDESRIYLTGFSAGGDVAWKYPNPGLVRAKRLAAAVPVAGYNYPYVDTGAKHIAAANLPVWALHSYDDGPAPYYWSQNFVNKINSYNPSTRAKFTRFSGVTHDNTKLHVYNPKYKVDGYSIYEWMLLYSRDYPPVAKAGSDISISLPVNAVALNGSSSYDPEGGAITYKWEKVSGPSQYSLNGATSANANVSNLLSGNYSFELTVTDKNGHAASDVVAITVINPNPIAPVAKAGADINLALPQNTAALNGSASSDEDGFIQSYQWTKIAGPTQFALSNATSMNASVSNLAKGTYKFRLQVQDNDGKTGADTVQVTVISTVPNILPVARAGNDISITLPTNSATINGSASSDADGSVVSYLWSQVSGPGAATIADNTAPVTTVSGLVQGAYTFKLKVTDDSDAVAEDNMVINVLKAPDVTSRYVKVNLYGGANAYNLDGWNNWVVTGETNITSSNFRYSDGTTSTISSVLSYSQGVPDNGSSYGGTMCPPPVLRYTSYSTAANRTLTIRGLNNAYKYDIEFYASRATTGNSTQFVINGVSKTVVTDNNKANKVLFTDVSPVNGQLVVSINKVGTFSYLNGFTITEKTTVQQSLTAMPFSASARSNALVDEEEGRNSILISPNPFSSFVHLSIDNSIQGKVSVTIANSSGNRVRQMEYVKNTNAFTITLYLDGLPAGTYFLHLKVGNRLYNQKLIKYK